MLAGGRARDLGSSRMLGSFILRFSHHHRYWAHWDSDCVIVTVTNVTIISYHGNEHLSPDSDHYRSLVPHLVLFPASVLPVA